MAVRNFYVTATTDGRSGTVTAGPGGAGGGMHIRLSQRDRGDIVPYAVDVQCIARSDGSLLTRVTVKGHDPIEYITQR